MQQIVERRGRLAGISQKITPHGLRRTHVTRPYAETKDLLLVQRVLDHRFVSTTQWYASIRV
ncbi:MAG TPA: tyrosine-type recombinase/integrase [Planctomycetota bacterium]|nr:tyrosine-type recombinase/integrase [Planctomycetota bacterium]